VRLLTPALLFGVIVALSAGTSPAIQPPDESRQPKATKDRELIVTAQPARAEPADKRPSGTWVREVNVNGTKLKITIVAEKDQLKVSYGDAKSSSYYMLDCNYAVTTDFVLFGVVNSVDGEPSERATDKPFRFRYRLDGNTLTIKDGSMENCPGIVSKVEGRYTRQP